jgi:hypothetical protein
VCNAVTVTVPVPVPNPDADADADANSDADADADADANANSDADADPDAGTFSDANPVCIEFHRPARVAHFIAGLHRCAESGIVKRMVRRRIRLDETYHDVHSDLSSGFG